MVKLKASNLSVICDAVARTNWTQRWEFESSPDLSGPGVLAGFLGTALLMMSMTTAYYFLAFDPRKDPFLGRRKTITEHHGEDWLVNSVDRYWCELMTPLRSRLGRISGTHGTNASYSGKIERAFNICVSNLSDAQTLTGIGILVSAYGTLDAGITVYHWKLAVYLAWYANLTHQSALIFLRGYLNEPQNIVQRHIKISAMSLLTVLLVAAMIPTAYFTTLSTQDTGGPRPDLPGDYAWCFVDMTTANQMMATYREIHTQAGQTMNLTSTASFQNMILSAILLLCTFSAKIFKISMRMCNFANYQLRRRVRLWCQGIIERVAGERLCSVLTSGLQPRTRPLRFLRWHLVVKPLLALYITGHVYVEFYTSMLSEICWLWISVVFLSFNMSDFIRWYSVGEYDRGSAGANSLSFGQILPVMLLAGPLLAIATEIASAILSYHALQAAGPASLHGPRFERAEESQLTISDEFEPAKPEHRAEKQEVQEQPVLQVLSIGATRSTDWHICGRSHKLGLRWAVLLLIVQLSFAVAATLIEYLRQPGLFTSGSTLQSFWPWYFVTLPSAMYFMVIFGIEARGSKRISIATFFITGSYSCLLWPRLTISFMCLFRGGAAPKESVAPEGCSELRVGLFHSMVFTAFTLLYILTVCMTALSPALFRRVRKEERQLNA